MTDHLKTIRDGLTDFMVGDMEALNKVFDALDAMEQAMREPMRLDHIACIEDGELRYMTGRKAPAHDCELYAMPDGKSAPPLFAAQPAQQAQPNEWYGALEFAARHLSSDWPEECQQMVRKARKALRDCPAQQEQDK